MWLNDYKQIAKAMAELRPAFALGLVYCGLLSFPAPAAAQSQYVPTNRTVFQYAVFYNQLLEFSTCTTLIIDGPVHANGSIYVGSTSPLSLNQTVTCTGSISSSANNSLGPWSFPGNVTFNGAPGYVTNLTSVALVFGTNSLHSIIELPLDGEDPSSPAGQKRFCNLAQVVVIVSNTTVTAKIQASVNGLVPGADPAPIMLTSINSSAALSTNFPFLKTTNKFYDQRENQTNLVTQIDVGKFAKWISTNTSVLLKCPAGSGEYPTIFYVADNRTNTATQLNCVRLANGIAPPQNGGQGWTVATPNPLYVWGNYNCTNASHLGTTNTSSAVPCAFVSDALTLLSANWDDTMSFTVSSTGPGASAINTVNAAIIAGIKTTTSPDASGFSGGVQNLPRLLENWSNSHLWLNTSLVCLYDSTKATGQFIAPGSSSYYLPPMRHFHFDPNFATLANQPPAAPLLAIPPVITASPQNLSILVGQDAQLGITAVGPGSLLFQWQFNGVNLDGATNSILTLIGVVTNQAGEYSVTVSNSSGSVTSAPAMLSVYSSVAAIFGSPSLSTNNEFQFAVSGVPDFTYVVETSTNLINWMPLATNTSPFTFVDSNAAELSQRFYRAVYLR